MGGFLQPGGKHMPANYEAIFPTPEDEQLLFQAHLLIHSYAEAGIMLDQTIEALAGIAATGMLCLALDENQEVVGTAAYTFTWPDGKKEFGAWAVKKDLQKLGIGDLLLSTLAEQNGHENIIAFGNHNSGPF
jgi:N-acetylglutamate synthase-like GNAT family acetyltransferase